MKSQSKKLNLPQIRAYMWSMEVNMSGGILSTFSIICIGPVNWTRNKKAFNANADRNNNTHTYGTTWNANFHFAKRELKVRKEEKVAKKMIFYDKIVSLGS